MTGTNELHPLVLTTSEIAKLVEIAHQTELGKEHLPEMAKIIEDGITRGELAEKGRAR